MKLDEKKIVIWKKWNMSPPTGQNGNLLKILFARHNIHASREICLMQRGIVGNGTGKLRPIGTHSVSMPLCSSRASLWVYRVCWADCTRPTSSMEGKEPVIQSVPTDCVCRFLECIHWTLCFRWNFHRNVLLTVMLNFCCSFTSKKT